MTTLLRIPLVKRFVTWMQPDVEHPLTFIKEADFGSDRYPQDPKAVPVPPKGSHYLESPSPLQDGVITLINGGHGPIMETPGKWGSRFRSWCPCRLVLQGNQKQRRFCSGSRHAEETGGCHAPARFKSLLIYCGWTKSYTTLKPR